MNSCYDFFWPTGFIIVFPLLNICRRFLVPFFSLSSHSKVFLVYSYLSIFFLHLQKLYTSIRFRYVWLKHSTMWTLMYYLYCCLYILFFQSFSLFDEVCTTHLKLFLNKQWLDFTPNLASPPYWYIMNVQFTHFSCLIPPRIWFYQWLTRNGLLIFCISSVYNGIVSLI